MDEKPCALCGSASYLKFELALVYGLVGHYYECSRCQFLHSDHLEADDSIRLVYTGELGEADAGAAWRERCVAERLIQLSLFGLFPRGQTCRFLDFGCGPGFVASLLRFRKGWDTYGFDPYIPSAYLRTRTLLSYEELMEHGPFDLVVATEVLEHFVNPRTDLDRISKILSDTGFVYVTTGLYHPQRGSDWSYLVPQGGQHVSFYSRNAIKEVARILGAPAVYRVGAEYEWLFVRSRALRWRAAVACKALSGLVGLGITRID